MEGKQMSGRQQVGAADDWVELKLRLKWPEQVEYERIRPPLVFDGSVAERARQTGTMETTLRRRIAGFGSEGMRSSLFETEQAEYRSTLDPEIRRLILDLKTEHPPGAGQRDSHYLLCPHWQEAARPDGTSGS